VITRQHGRFGEQEECESLFIAPCCYFFWGFNRLSALHTIFLSSFLLTLFLISTYWNSKDSIIHSEFIFLCKHVAGCWWFMPAGLAAQVVEIRRIVVPTHPGQIVQETLSWKKPIMEKDWWSGSTCSPWVQIPFPQKKVFSQINVCILQVHDETCFWNIHIICMWQVLFYIMCI
jgi:hypothetical protein